MTDKVQKILSEIATRKLCTMDEHMAFYNDKAKEDYRLLSDIEEFIKALQKEPVSEDLEEAAKERVDAEDYCCVDEDGMPLYDSDYLEYMFKEGAQWQKQQMKKEACKWLDENLEKYIDADGECNIDWNFINDFKKRLEE